MGEVLKYTFISPWVVGLFPGFRFDLV
uniref:Uncharacterized protein n=1 Tax=Rhizophora mucronata TaxID=61149 RepID=A0A2P2P980_RHIMU